MLFIYFSNVIGIFIKLYNSVDILKVKTLNFCSVCLIHPVLFSTLLTGKTNS